MDIATLLGLVIGVTVVGLAVLTGSELWIFLNVPGFLIVLGGTFAATLIKFPISTVFSAFKLGLTAAFVNEKSNPRSLIELAVSLAEKTRAGGLLALEEVKIDDEFFRKGIRLCIDGHDGDVVRKALTSDMELSIQRHEEGGKIFRGIGDSAPAFGMIGTLVGLVQMLSNMEDPKTIGPAMAIALLTTLYGALIANLVALPIADKLEQERVIKSLIVDGVMQIHARQNPRIVEELLQVYLPTSQRQTDSEEVTEKAEA
ncbi:MAG: MotA/TolQ/ExbB proton channel family protein [Rhodospirillales bacterium]|nr:MotA/TolQ/ExbB proton channel family protein [Rhodospirillales bacterium]